MVTKGGVLAHHGALDVLCRHFALLDGDLFAGGALQLWEVHLKTENLVTKPHTQKKTKRQFAPPTTTPNIPTHPLIGGFNPPERYEFIRLDHHPTYWGK